MFRATISNSNIHNYHSPFCVIFPFGTLNRFIFVFSNKKSWSTVFCEAYKSLHNRRSAWFIKQQVKETLSGRDSPQNRGNPLIGLRIKGSQGLRTLSLMLFESELLAWYHVIKGQSHTSTWCISVAKPHRSLNSRHHIIYYESQTFNLIKDFDVVEILWCNCSR